LEDPADEAGHAGQQSADRLSETAKHTHTRGLPRPRPP